ncbi:MAG: cytochrome c3 family protein [Planctomycetota bacterium]
MWRLTLRNPWAFIGVLLAVVAGGFHLTLMVSEVVAGSYNPYLNIAFHLILPPLVIAGIAMIWIGWVRTRRQVRRGELTVPEKGALPANRVVALLLLLIVLLIPFLAFTSYSGYHYSESVEFCGQACHVPMGPTYTTYQHSPHASVPCTDCHVGDGAWWFVRAKLNGTRQLISMMTDSFERPIPSPLENMRPVGDICNRCHWAEMPKGTELVHLPRFASDESNTPHPVYMTLDIGRVGTPEEPARGIHWHAATEAHFVEYVATDRQRLDIPWVRLNVGGESIVYRSDGLPSDAPPPEGELRVMDCLDCHNRPAHQHDSASEILDRLLDEGEIASLPFIKREGVELIAADYDTSEEGQSAIRSGLIAFYRESYPEVAAERSADIEKAASRIAREFGLNVFPEMNSDWRVRPDHIGHLDSPGCQRCHDGKHVSSNGQAIQRDCQLCHTFMAAAEDSASLVESEFPHPFALEGAHAEIACSSCHHGGPMPEPTCTGCHAEIDRFLRGEHETVAEVIGVTPGKHAEVACEDCHYEPTRVEPSNTKELCLECHDEELGDTPSQWRAELDRLRSAAGQALDKGNGERVQKLRKALEVLDRVGALHDFEQSKALLEAAGKK